MQIFEETVMPLSMPEEFRAFPFVNQKDIVVFCEENYGSLRSKGGATATR
jgi:hypothetical protein